MCHAVTTVNRVQDAAINLNLSTIIHGVYWG